MKGKCYHLSSTPWPSWLALQTCTQPAIAVVPYPARQDTVVNGQTCPSEEQGRMIRNQISSELLTIISQLSFCGGDPGWTRIAFLNMTDTSDSCPSPWFQVQDFTRSCRKSMPRTAGCASVFYNTSGSSYNRVCGRILGYQHGLTQAFIDSALSIDDVYVDGVSITHGSPRQHIWTFAAGRAETNYLNYSCPCVDGSTNGPNVPAFVGQNYFCEAGVRTWNESMFFADDPLWDGQGCGPTSSCCTFNSPPWFRVQLPSTTSDAIEVRLCHEYFQVQSEQRAPIELMELYIK